MRAFLLAVVSVTLLGCIVEPPLAGGTQPTPAALTPAPPAEVKSGANFGDAFELVSVVINPSRGVQGMPVRVMANFKVNKKIEQDFMIFVHVEDVDGKIDRLNVDHAPMRGARPTSKWTAGELVRDEFEIPIPPQMNVRGLNILMGFWDPKTDARLPLVNKDVIPNDGNNRIMAARFQVNPAQ